MAFALTITEVGKDDNAAIDAVRQLLLAYASWRNFDKALGLFEEEIRDLPGAYSSPEGLLLLAKLNGKPVGCVAYRKLEEGICEMKRMYVSPDARGQKIGQQMLNQLLPAAANAGYHLMRLDTHPSMLTAQELYQNIGFVECPRYNNNPIEGIRFFEKALG